MGNSQIEFEKNLYVMLQILYPELRGAVKFQKTIGK